jgi:hypothetical protein
MRRREFIALMGASIGWLSAAGAEQAGRTYRLGVLAPGSRSDEGMRAFFDGVRRSGFIEGQNLTVIYHDFTLKITSSYQSIGLPAALRSRRPSSPNSHHQPSLGDCGPARPRGDRIEQLACRYWHRTSIDKGLSDFRCWSRADIGRDRLNGAN